MVAGLAFELLREPKYKEFGNQSIFWVIIAFDRVLGAVDVAL
jgi:hypothetical protein